MSRLIYLQLYLKDLQIASGHTQQEAYPPEDERLNQASQMLTRG